MRNRSDRLRSPSSILNFQTSHSRTASLCALLLALALAVFTQKLWAHGSFRVPLSREYNCFLEGPQNPQSEACKAAIAEAGAAQFYNWDGVNRMDANDRHREIIPDGQLCSGGKESHRGLNLARTDWVTQIVAPNPDGTFEFVYRATAPHSTRYFEFYITKNGHDHTQPLKWSDLEAQPFCSITEVELADDAYRMICPMPLTKEGKQIIYSIWQRNDSQEAFYSCSDVEFDYSNVVVTPTPVLPTPTATSTPQPVESTCQINYAIDNDWGAGFGASVEITNLGSAALNGWELTWDYAGTQTLTNAWESVYQQTGPACCHTKRSVERRDWPRRICHHWLQRILQWAQHNATLLRAKWRCVQWASSSVDTGINHACRDANGHSYVYCDIRNTCTPHCFTNGGHSNGGYSTGKQRPL